MVFSDYMIYVDTIKSVVTIQGDMQEYIPYLCRYE
ncbi:hypothetical protein HNQ54_003368 [Anaerocolumna cellulosilytica]|nr:hypothetical protein [Anaerocolumna cellulosilytica]